MQQETVTALTRHCLGLCNVLDLRRVGKSSLWERVWTTTDQRAFTHCYQYREEIDTFVTDRAPPGTAAEVIRILESYEHHELPRLVTDRSVTAWRNGIYFARLPAFHLYG